MISTYEQLPPSAIITTLANRYSNFVTAIYLIASSATTDWTGTRSISLTEEGGTNACDCYADKQKQLRKFIGLR